MNRDLDTWVAKGYAVVQTDIVRAARALDTSIGRDWVVAGHSQSGQATLFTAQNAGTRAPELDLKGAVSIAPGGVGLSGAVDYLRGDRPGPVAHPAGGAVADGRVRASLLAAPVSDSDAKTPLTVGDPVE